MRKRVIILFILLLIVLGVLGYIIISQKQAELGPDEELTFAETVRNYFPFGRDDSAPFDPNNLPPTGNSTSTENQLPESKAKLRQISAVPVVGFTSTSTPSGLVVRYMEKQDGHVYDANLESRAVERVSNQTFQGIINIVFSKSADRYAFQHLSGEETIRTFVGTFGLANASSTDTVGDLVGSYISDNLLGITMSSSGDSLIYQQSASNGSRFYSLDISDTESGPDLLFSSPFYQWQTSYVGDEKAFVYTNPSGKAPGDIYVVDIPTGLFSRQIGGVNGLSATANKDGSRIVYSYSSGGAFGTKVLDVSFQQVIDVAINTLSDKCAWDTVQQHILYCGVPVEPLYGLYPDPWYQGEVSFSDEIWRIDTGRNVVEIIQPSSMGLDIVSPHVSVDGKYLLFKNKIDQTLWSLVLDNVVEVTDSPDLESEPD